MTNLLIVLAFLFSIQSYACNKSIDSSRVILFVDANDSPKEIASAKLAACTRGENLVVTEPDDFDERVKQLASSGTSISSLIASGHDGGGEFSGENGETTKSHMLSSLTNAYEDAGKIDLLKDLHGLYLWGCYTTVPAEINYWNSRLPNLKFIVGFQGEGPSNTNATGIKMLRSSLESQGRVEQAKTENELKKALNQIQGINSTFSATFVNKCEQMKDQYYYTNTSNEHGGLDRKFASYSETKACLARIEEFSEGDPSMETILDNYMSGEEPIPKSTRGTNLREIYSYLRQNDHCFSGVFEDEIYHDYNANTAGLLLFYHGVKKNFPGAFKDEITRAEPELKNVVKKIMSQEDYSQIPEEFREQLENAWLPTMENISNKSRKEILENLSMLSELTWIGDGRDIERENLEKLVETMETYLNYMPGQCMSFLDWHEYIPGRVPRSRCPENMWEYWD